jgi:chromosome partitioning protein
MDPQSNASSGVGLPPLDRKESVYSALIGKSLIQELIVPTELSSLGVVPATPDLAAAEVELVDDEHRATKLRTVLEPIRSLYDFIVLDCPPSLGLLTINALVAADVVMVPMQCEYYALEGLTRLMGTLDRVRSLNPLLRLHGVLLTMFDPRSNLALQVADEVRRHFHVYDTVIPRNIRLAEAPSHGKPAILYDPGSKGSSGYLSLARELLGGLNN